MRPRPTRDASPSLAHAAAPDPTRDPYYAMLLQWLADDADQGDEVGFEPEQALRADKREGGSA